jgi:ParB family chromosome partitioning protein
LRDRLTEREIDAYRHPLVRFVGLDTYEAAGGGIRRDLFAEGDAGVYLTDAALLERLAQDKLAGIAAEVRPRAGHGWMPRRATHADLHAFQRAPRSAARPNKREAQRIEKLQAKMHELAEAVDAALDAETRTRPMPCRKAKPGEQLQALEDGLQDYGRTEEGRSRCHRHHRPQRRGRDSSRPDARSRSQGAAHAGTLRQGFGGEGEAGTTTKARTTSSPRPPPCPTGWRSG